LFLIRKFEKISLKEKRRDRLLEELGLSRKNKGYKLGLEATINILLLNLLNFYYPFSLRTEVKGV